MFWSITAALALEWLVAMAFRVTLHGAIHGLLVLAALSLLLALVTRVHGGAARGAAIYGAGAGSGADAVRNSTYSARA